MDADVHAKQFGIPIFRNWFNRMVTSRCVHGQSYDNLDISILMSGKSSHSFSITNVFQSNM